MKIKPTRREVTGAEIVTFIDVIKGNSTPGEIQVLPFGHFETTNYPPFDLTNEIFDKMVANFNADGIRAGVPIDTDHDSGEANGWITQLINRGSQGLWAQVEWTTKGAQLLG